MMHWGSAFQFAQPKVIRAQGRREFNIGLRQSQSMVNIRILYLTSII
jgi:hypothetical protein